MEEAGSQAKRGMAGHRECRIGRDWLVYQVEADCNFVRLGTGAVDLGGSHLAAAAM
jgi:mRNA-degrading endonuclease YafQ of YafQ-DinJ toxin-antitoxin module